MRVRFLLASVLVLFAADVAAQGLGAGSNALPANRTGQDIYNATCITCHAADGTGSPKAVVGFDAALPDFTDCAFASAEADLDWYSVVHEGSPIRGLGTHMPAFGDALTPDDIRLAVSHVQSFCTDRSWPRGDLNLPRAFFTEKAFPENEAVWSTSLTRGTAASMGNTFLYERRLGSRGQVEVSAPVDLQKGGSGWMRGLGDVAFGYKRVVHSNLETGRIASAGAELILPTGKEAIGLGNGHAVFEPFVLFGQLLPRNSYVQVHAGVEFPTDTTEGTRETFLRTAAGTTFFGDRGFGRAWSPQVEFLMAKPQGQDLELDLVPELQITLSKLQHVAIAVGVRVPLTERDSRSAQGLFYLLWDWYDGGFFEFWK
jgi:mono/diheme cytochrome c family protein